MRPYLTSAGNGLSRKIRVVSFLVSLALVAGLQPVSGVSSPEEVGPKMEVDRLLSLPSKSVVLIDTRSSFKFFLGHLPGAVNLNDWRDFTQTQNGVPGLLVENRKFIAGKLRSLGIDYGKSLVVYGDAEELWRTDGRFFWMFHYFGFEKVFILEGGYKHWVAQGGVVERGRANSVSPSSLMPEDIRFNLGVAADRNWIAKRLGSPSLVLVDNRDRKEFDGATPYGSSRGGHIPGAVHMDWRRFFMDKGMLKDRSALLALLKQNGIRQDQEIVVYCTGGVRSGMAYFVFKYLGFNTRNYDGSWWDWSRHRSLPAEL
ncbi:MAG: rhodanese-like domain-containing protein [Nitrospinota bacterium]|nr:rhodanese-like domain-containing protein [Nitrospinota bacterium]